MVRHHRPEEPSDPGQQGEAGMRITNAVVEILHTHTGRGPTRAATVFGPDLVVVTLQEYMTTHERVLAAGGQEADVLLMRRALQGMMRLELIAAVERETGRTVTAMLSDNLYQPDIAVEVFVLNPELEGQASSWQRSSGTS